MATLEAVDLPNDDEREDAFAETSEPSAFFKQETYSEIKTKIEPYVMPQEYGENLVQRNLGAETHTNASCPPSALRNATRPLCREFWKSGDYEFSKHSISSSQGSQSHLLIHPKFLHSNATSHKWVFGAIAELLDNAVDEVQNGATFVLVDRFICPRTGAPALLIQDDGGGMNPESLRHCMSFGFSDKRSDSSIGQYGNGFKTSTMRLGADVIVFTRCRKSTQSIGLLSYTFLRETGRDDIVVPVIDYEFNMATSETRRHFYRGRKQYQSNLDTILEWSPFSGEDELIKQFGDIGDHGTKIIVSNLWFNDDGKPELDFDSDSKDILINGAQREVKTKSTAKLLVQKHIAARIHYSLRVYVSVLYRQMPKDFQIILLGEEVEPHCIIHDLKYIECIKYRPHFEGTDVAEVITFIGYLKDAPEVDIHGFNVYHKNRLILPFLKVANNSAGKGRGVVGVLEANFIKPTHDKQDFEKSPAYQKLEVRLKEMTYEYWDYHCHLIGYSHSKVSVSEAEISNTPQVYQLKTGLLEKRKNEYQPCKAETLKKQAVNGQGSQYNMQKLQKHERDIHLLGEIESMTKENKKLQNDCLEYEKAEKLLMFKLGKLRHELEAIQQFCKTLLGELKMD